MSYLSQNPEVYRYNNDHGAFQFERHQPHITQSHEFYPKPSINFGPSTSHAKNLKESMINRVYEPFQKTTSQPPMYQLNSKPHYSTFSANQPYLVNRPSQRADIPTNLNSNYKSQNNVDNQFTETKVERFDHYLDQEQSSYKYNIFSVIDEPWNRCMLGQNCGNCPSNQCISRSTIKRQWYE